jgi:hypothetical protein
MSALCKEQGRAIVEEEYPELGLEFCFFGKGGDM